MMTPEEFETLARRIGQVTGLPDAAAEDLAARIGDTPVLSEDGREIVVSDDEGREIARIPLVALEDDPAPVTFAAPVISGVELRLECLRLILEREGREEVATLSGRPPIEEWSRGEGCTGWAADVRVRELWARWALWSCAGLPESVADAPQVLSAEDAAEALANHVEALEEIFNAGDGHEE